VCQWYYPWKRDAPDFRVCFKCWIYQNSAGDCKLCREDGLYSFYYPSFLGRPNDKNMMAGNSHQELEVCYQKWLNHLMLKGPDVPVD